jgi:branched-chain amino acid transport system permease protein
MSLTRLQTAWSPAVLIAVVAVATLATGSGDAQPALLNLMLVIGLYVFIGNSGVFSFGHVAFMALGAYSCALLTIPAISKQMLLPDLPGVLEKAELSTPVAVLLSAAFVGVVAFLVSVPLMRLSGLAAGIASLALLVIVRDVVTNSSTFTGGSGNLTGIPSDTTSGGLLLWAIAAIVVAFVYQRSRFGRRLRASREDEVAARASGIRVERERRIAFTLSAVITAAAGGLYGHQLGSIGPDSFYLSTTFLIIAMLVIGGVHSMRGAVSGVLVVTAVTLILDRWEAGDHALGIALKLPAGTREIALSLVVIVVLLLRPEGISHGREVPWPSRGFRRAANTSEDAVPVGEGAQPVKEGAAT